MRTVGLAFLICFCQQLEFMNAIADKQTYNLYYAKVDADMDGTKYEKSALNSTDFLEITFSKLAKDFSNGYTFKLMQNKENVTIGTSSDKSDVYLVFKNKEIILKMKSEASRAGKYEFTVLNEKTLSNEYEKTFEIFSPAFVKKFTKSRRVLEGDALEIICVAYGYPLPVITWTRDLAGTDEIKAGPGFNVAWNVTANKTKLPGDTLVFEAMKFSDSGLYQCNATNEYGSDVSVIKVRVKDRLAALWPFIGICIEVAILVTVILVYEKKRANSKKALVEEDNADVADAKDKDADGKTELRQRNVKA